MALGGLLVVVMTIASPAQESATESTAAVPEAGVPEIFEADPAPPIGTRHALILCGLSGDAPHREKFCKLVEQWQQVLTTKLGFQAADVKVLTGDEPEEGDSELIRNSPRSSREEIEQAAKSLCTAAKSDDAVWVIVLGHSHFDSRKSWLNVPGPDIEQNEFAALFQDLAAQQQVFLIMTPTSGQYIKPLSKVGRVVIAATEADWETNETELPYELASLLESPPAKEEFDIDGDGTMSLFDAYLTVARKLAQSYLDRELLSTEHALLDDNGDGRGTELQIDYLTVEQGGRMRPGRSTPPIVQPNTDGHLSRTIELPLAP